MNYIIVLFIIIVYFIINKNKEQFTPNEFNHNYIELDDKYCLLTKNIGPKGGFYESKILKGKLPKLFDNQKAILINEDFTEEICKKKKFGSGRQNGGFVCYDFITKEKAKKYNLIYSDKTCFDNLKYEAIYPDYLKKISTE